MKSAPLGLAGCQDWSLTTEALPVDGDRMTALIHYERQRWKKVNFFAKKLLPRSLFQHVQTLCMPSFIDLHTHATAGHASDVVCLQLCKLQSCSRNTSGRSLAWSHHTKIYAIKVNMKHFRQTARSCLSAPVEVGMRHGEAIYLAIVLDGDHLVMTGHNARRPRTGREKEPWWLLSEASYLTVWTLNDRFFASLVYCMIRRVLSEYWRKETEKSKVFLWSGRLGRSLLCQGRAEKETRGSWPTTGCLPVDRNKLGLDSWRDEKGVWYRTHTHTHTHGIKAPWTTRSPALARRWHPARINKRLLLFSAGLV